ncbi:MAG: hypothetical protein KJ043_18030, partial [Anaerolineae bacterium]|nr:hypothetical protein [Anaerolineae bacterium]
APMTGYNLHLAVYSLSAPSGFDILDDAGNPMGVETVLDNAIYTDGGAFSSPPPAPSLVTGDDILQTGVPFTVTVIIPPNSRYIELSGDGYDLNFPVPPSNRATLAWARFTIPPNSGEGIAILMVDGVAIHEFALEDLTRTFEEPSSRLNADAHFVGVGRLVGFDVDVSLPDNNPFSVELIWRADAQANLAVSYTVFVQLLDENGRVVAQSDAQPDNWQRPTTSWVDGEYITDVHILNFNTEFVGTGKLIVGFYDATDNFRRVLTDTGMDFAELPIAITVVMP